MSLSISVLWNLNYTPAAAVYGQSWATIKHGEPHVNDIVSRDIAWKHMIPFHRKNIYGRTFISAHVWLSILFSDNRGHNTNNATLQCYVQFTFMYTENRILTGHVLSFFWCFDVEITFKFCFCSQWQVYQPTRSTSKLFKCFGQRRCKEVLQGWDKWLRMIKAAMTKKMVKDIT